MAGEWLKLECSTPDKPEVFAITQAMGWDDPDLTVGKLFRVWRWFDQQTLDGNARSVTQAFIDRVAGVTGFAKAMISVGWLLITSDGICLPNFEKHNGATAKGRAQTAKRVAAFRGKSTSDAPVTTANETGNAASVTSALAREEKKRSNTPNPRKRGNVHEFPPGFDRFWSAYPRKVAKPGAEKAFARLRPDDALLDVMLAALGRQCEAWTDPQFIPHPASWLNARRWEDEGGAVVDKFAGAI